MNLLGMGPGELMLIAVLGLVIFGPGKLPEIAAQVGKAIRDFRTSTHEIRNEFQRNFSLDELTSPSSSASSATAEAEPTDAAPVEAATVPAETPSWEAAPAPVAEPVAGQSDSIWVWDAPEPQAVTIAASSAPSEDPWAWEAPAAAEPVAANGTVAESAEPAGSDGAVAESVEPAGSDGTVAAGESGSDGIAEPTEPAPVAEVAPVAPPTSVAAAPGDSRPTA